MSNPEKRLRRKVRNSYIVSTTSIALVLFLLGTVGYLMVAALQIARDLQESIPLTAELRVGLGTEGKEGLRAELEAMEPVAGVLYLSKEEKAADEEFRRLFDSAFEEVLGENPLCDSFEITLDARYTAREQIEAFIAEAERLPGVDRIFYPALVAERMHATLGKIRLVLLLFGGALLVISLVLLGNTIRLAIYSKRYLINTMKLVGATRWFIMKPFLGHSLMQGVLAGIGASLLFGGAVYGLGEAVPEFTSMAEAARVAAITGAMIAGGMVISGLFTALALNKFINMQSNKIHLY